MKDLSTLVLRFAGQPLQELGLSLLALRLLCRHQYFAELFDYWTRDCSSELHLSRLAREIFAGWHIVEQFSISLSVTSAEPLRQDPGLMAIGVRVSVTSRFYASRFCTLLWLHFNRQPR